MTTFSFTTGNPANLTGGAAASMTDIGGSLTDIQTFLNGANIDTTNLATSAKPSNILTPYRLAAECSSWYGDNVNASGIKAFGFPTLRANATGFAPAAGLAESIPAFPFVTTDYTVSGLTAKARFRFMITTNTVVPAITFTFGLYPVTFAGAADVVVPTLGTVVSGSTVAFASPSASGSSHGMSAADIDLPTTGVYMFGVNLSAAVTANAAGIVHGQMLIHWV